MFKQELLKNKLYAGLFVMIGVVSMLISLDATFFIFTLVVGIPLFFSKRNWIV